MTVRVLPRTQLPQHVSSLFADRHLIILTPATGDLGWASEAVWECARAAASGRRGILLVDLSVQQATLDRGATTIGQRGITDAFRSDAPLEDVTSEQDRPRLHYIGRGTPLEDPALVWASPRWRRLARGFASEGALLLLFAPPEALTALDVAEDGLVVLAPDGYDPANGTFPKIADRLARGSSLLGVVANPSAIRSSQPHQRPSGSRPAIRRPSRTTGPHRRRRGPAYAGLAGLLLIAAALVVIWARGSGTESARETGARGARPPDARRAASPAPGSIAGDSLYYSVQVAAYNTLSQAVAHASGLESSGRLAIVTPVRLGSRGLWYRVLVGALPTARAADSALKDLWGSGLVERPQGTILRTPEAIRVKARASKDHAIEDVRGLRGRGIPAYIVQAPDGTALVYVGAFDLPEQARAADSLLAAASLRGTLVQRTGIVP